MIDFRYHLVSIIAVFLALAVGLLVGATALSGKSLDVLNRAEKDAQASNAALTKTNKQLKQQVTADQAFAQAAAPRLLGRLLAGDKVVLIIAPGADGNVVSGVTTALGQADATVTGQIQLTQQFMQTTGPVESGLTQLATSLAPAAGIALPAAGSNQGVAGQQDAAAVIAASLLTKDGGGLGASASRSILSGFAQNGYLTIGPSGVTTPATATLAVLVTPGGAPPQTGNASQVLVAVAQQLNSAGSGTVMAGSVSAIGSGSAIQRENSAGQVSTVDNADTESGQIMVVQALKLQLDGKSPQSYGIGPGTAPSPAPVAPSASPSVSLAAIPASSAKARQ